MHGGGLRQSGDAVGARNNSAPWGRLPHRLSALLIKCHSACAGTAGLFKASAAVRTGETASNTCTGGGSGRSFPGFSRAKLTAPSAPQLLAEGSAGPSAPQNNSQW
ncbi:hypothetical protein SKAU_G00356270 [Synaphobranchus kaupii]|uniref:Uncharacterized protein n=1 Tax=Synaphobranchus kaupii TaxID=118154 RepID=A0A9Q1EHD9_SYNKA|nr:hypothetical protein SKAU_G00356270 [Synaphobranchus kaupii]